MNDHEGIPLELLPGDEVFLRRLIQLEARRAETQAAADEAIADLLAQVTREDAMRDLGLDLDRLADGIGCQP